MKISSTHWSWRRSARSASVTRPAGTVRRPVATPTPPPSRLGNQIEDRTIGRRADTANPGMRTNGWAPADRPSAQHDRDHGRGPAPGPVRLIRVHPPQRATAPGVGGLGIQVFDNDTSGCGRREGGLGNEVDYAAPVSGCPMSVPHPDQSVAAINPATCRTSTSRSISAWRASSYTSMVCVPNAAVTTGEPAISTPPRR